MKRGKRKRGNILKKKEEKEKKIGKLKLKGLNTAEGVKIKAKPVRKE
jgi:hypothetical protein